MMPPSRPTPRQPRRSPSEVHRRPTPHPGFDVAKFARESERHMRAAERSDEVPTGPPPPYHPASLPPEAPRATGETTVIPPSLADQLRTCGARIALLRSQLATGDLSREEAASALRLELGAIEAGAGIADVDALVALVRGLGGVVEELAGAAAAARPEPLRVVVVDDDVTVRDRVVLAVESLGHPARGAAGVAELAQVGRTGDVDVVLVSAARTGAPLDAQLGDVLRELARTEQAHVVVYTRAVRADADAIARDCGARHCFCASSDAVGAIAAQLAPILDDAAW